MKGLHTIVDILDPRLLMAAVKLWMHYQRNAVPTGVRGFRVRENDTAYPMQYLNRYAEWKSWDQYSIREWAARQQYGTPTPEEIETVRALFQEPIR